MNRLARSPEPLLYAIGLLLAIMAAVQMGAIAQAPAAVTITLVRWPFT